MLVIHVAKLGVDVSVYDVVVIVASCFIVLVYIRVVAKALHDGVKLAFRRPTSLIQSLIGTKGLGQRHLWLVVIVSIRHLNRIRVIYLPAALAAYTIS